MTKIVTHSFEYALGILILAAAVVCFAIHILVPT